MKHILLTSCLLLLLSCHKQEFNILSLIQETPIKSIDYPNEMIMSFPLGIDIIENKLLVFMHKGEHVIRVFDANNGIEINRTGIFGNGPGEFIQPIYCGVNKEKDIYIYDVGQKKLRKYNWGDIINTAELPKIEGIPLKDEDAVVVSGIIMSNENLVGSIMVGMSKPITIFNKDLTVLENIGTLPDEKHQSKSLISYWGTLSAHGDKFVFTMASFGYIACYEQQPNGASKMIWDRYAEKPLYKGDQLDRKELMLGFSDVKMTKNFIFCSYFGQKYVRNNRENIKVRNILIFDHMGNLLQNLRADRSVGKITVSEDEKALYAITEEPEVAIIRFDISDLIK